MENGNRHARTAEGQPFARTESLNRHARSAAVHRRVGLVLRLAWKVEINMQGLRRVSLVASRRTHCALAAGLPPARDPWRLVIIAVHSGRACRSDGQ
jgi:hypothetical protein